MSSGKDHALSTTLAAGSLGPMLFMVAKQPAEQALAFTAGCLLGVLLTPDLDVDHGSKSNAIMRQSAGCFVGAAWRLFWLPYAKLIPHRSLLSHMPIFGTALRLLYLLAVPVLIWSLLQQVLPLPAWSYPDPSPLFWWAVAGLVVSDTLHAVMDWV